MKTTILIIYNRLITFVCKIFKRNGSVFPGSLVKKLTGEVFIKKVQAKRCSIVAEKLLNTDLPVGEIIADVGYENESFFRKIFNEKYGENPLDYRKNGLRN